jgi:hypothetical protein
MNVIEINALTRPAWVDTLLGESRSLDESFLEDNFVVRVVESDQLGYIQVLVPGAGDLDSRAFQQCVIQVYGVIRKRLAQRDTCHPLRFWNFIPGIHDAAHEGQDRYEVFNAGRFEAFSKWHGTRHFESEMVAASGVGHRGHDLVVQVLAAKQAGRGVENPRQRPAYRYSKRYGPMPPCFARATLAACQVGDPNRRMMIVAGTASIIGEDSCHHGQLVRQFEETCKNLVSLTGASLTGAPVAEKGKLPDPLSLFQELRVYLRDDEDREELLALLVERFSRLEHLELMSADLCRSDLLVEIESMVNLGWAG